MADGLPPGEYDLVVANLPYVREDEWDGLEPEITPLRAARGARAATDGLDAHPRARSPRSPPGTRVALEHAPGSGRGDPRSCWTTRRSYPDLADWDRITVGRAP